MKQPKRLVTFIDIEGESGRIHTFRVLEVLEEMYWDNTIFPNLIYTIDEVVLISDGNTKDIDFTEMSNVHDDRMSKALEKEKEEKERL